VPVGKEKGRNFQKNLFLKNPFKSSPQSPLWGKAKKEKGVSLGEKKNHPISKAVQVASAPKGPAARYAQVSKRNYQKKTKIQPKGKDRKEGNRKGENE